MAAEEPALVADRGQRESVVVDAPADRIYDLVADMPRMGEWSPECATGRLDRRQRRPPHRTRRSSVTTGAVPAGSCSGRDAGACSTADRGREFAFVTEEGGREGDGLALPVRTRR